jgi:hypothetical protein
MTKQMDIEINGFHTNCLRIILGIKRIDKVTNDEIFSKSSSQPLTHTIRQRQLRYLGHALRMEDSEPAKKFALYEPTHGKRKRGGQSLSFHQYIASILPGEQKKPEASEASNTKATKKRKLDAEEARPENTWTRELITESTQNRRQWRSIVAGAGQTRF